jgi:hypothetical protein
MSTVFWGIGALAFSCLLALWTYNMGHKDGYYEGLFDGKDEG